LTVYHTIMLNPQSKEKTTKKRALLLLMLGLTAADARVRVYQLGGDSTTVGDS
jgi:hypothetical protein